MYFFQPTGNYNGSVYVDYFTITPYTYSVVKADNPNIQYYGRWDRTDAVVAKSGWGTTYIIAGFYGTSLTLRLSAWDTRFAYAIDDFSDHKNFIKIRVKNQKDQYYATPTQTPYTITGLTDGPHKIMLVRTSEGMSGIVNFAGFGLDMGKTLYDPGPRPTRKMEFIGDSITCGALNEWQGSNPCPNEWGGCISNGDLTFGPMLARMYGAEWMTICRGGIGIYRNCNGCNPPATMPTVYPKVFFEMTPTPTTPDWNFSGWQADVVVIALGTNDFSSGTPDKTAFQNAYSNFLTTLRSYYPNAFILCTEPIPSWMGKTAGDYINEVVTNKNDPKIFYVPINNPPIASGFPLQSSEYAGDNTHPTVAAHEKIANALKGWIDANIKDDLGW
ncbi:MAG: GDSL-type esterase/lipase family protein [Spirochaetes bacterium]|nr:GDSL-type esterase/lipase family protein [Spirochaetota bacterium]